MKIIFLTNNYEITEPLYNWLKFEAKEEVLLYSDNLTIEFLDKNNVNMIISYNYKYLIKEDILKYVQNRTINLHISLLPWNRGSHPNLWSIFEDNPKGVTIHYIDEGIDTGHIIVQKEVYIDEDKETLKSSYEILHREIQALFKENWNKIKNGEINPQPQTGGGSIHFKRENTKFESFLKEKGWNTTIRELKERYSKYRTETSGC